MDRDKIWATSCACLRIQDECISIKNRFYFCIEATNKIYIWGFFLKSHKILYLEDSKTIVCKKSEYQPIFASIHLYKIEFGKVVCNLTMCLAFCAVSKMIKNMHCGTSEKCKNQSSELFVKINRVYVIINSVYRTFILLILTNKCFIIIANVHKPLFLAIGFPK